MNKELLEGLKLFLNFLIFFLMSGFVFEIGRFLFKWAFGNSCSWKNREINKETEKPWVTMNEHTITLQPGRYIFKNGEIYREIEVQND